MRLLSTTPIVTMLSVHSRMVVCARHGLRRSNRLITTNRRCLFVKASASATRFQSVACRAEDTKHSGSDTSRLFKERDATYRTCFNSLRAYCSAQVQLNCWNCKRPLKETPAFFCVSCKVVQPPSERASYFEIMECDQTFTLDTKRLRKRYLQLQQSLHPDNFSQKAVREQAYSEGQSALVNKAYRTLLEPLSRGLYMLELEGIRIEEGTDSWADAHLLLELMEINEALDKAQSPHEASSIGQSTKVKLKDLTERIDVALRKGELQAAKALLVQMKYFSNVEEKVKEKLSKLV